jgi:CheY-like chemotaxis protein
MTTALMNPEQWEDTDAVDRVLSRAPGILIADDRGLTMTLLKRELEPRGFNVWLALDGNDALDVYWRNRAQIDLVLLDVQMPDLDGPQTLAHLQQLDPNVVACFMTGDPGIYTEEELLQRGAIRVFMKPFRMAELVGFLEKVAFTLDPTPFLVNRQTTAPSNVES